MTFRARKKQTTGYDLGFVGEFCAVDTLWFDAIWNEGGIPVLYSLALGSDGEYYNVNAVQMASACAIACKADTLVFLTDVPGVKDADGSVMPWLTIKQVPMLIAGSVVGGGMLPKLEACSNALKRGVGRVRILPAAQAEVLPQFYFQKLEYGTEVIGA
jgi:acetylglutamate kinase